MQKIVNVLAVASATVSLAVVGLGGYLYVQRDAIIEDIKEQAMEAVLGGLGGLGSGVGGSVPSDLPLGTPDLAPTVPQASLPEAEALQL